MFARLLKKTKINAANGTGFYTLRRTAATLAARSGDPFAVQRLLGHVNLEMATRYVQDVSAQTDRVIENSREYLVGGRSGAWSKPECGERGTVAAMLLGYRRHRSANE